MARLFDETGSERDDDFDEMLEGDELPEDEEVEDEEEFEDEDDDEVEEDEDMSDDADYEDEDKIGDETKSIIVKSNGAVVTDESLVIPKGFTKQEFDAYVTEAKDAVSFISSCLINANKNILPKYYRIGEIALNLYKSEGTTSIQTFADYIGMSRTNMARAIELVRSWGKDGLQTLIERGLTISHVDKLSGVKDPDKRKELAVKAGEEKQTVSELAKTIDAEEDKAAANGESILSKGSAGRRAAAAAKATTPSKVFTGLINQCSIIMESIGSATVVIGDMSHWSASDVLELKATFVELDDMISNVEKTVGAFKDLVVKAIQLSDGAKVEEKKERKMEEEPVVENVEEGVVAAEPKRRGRPKKVVDPNAAPKPAPAPKVEVATDQPKRGRGRPKKIVVAE